MSETKKVHVTELAKAKRNQNIVEVTGMIAALAGVLVVAGLLIWGLWALWSLGFWWGFVPTVIIGIVVLVSVMSYLDESSTDIISRAERYGTVDD